MKNLNLLNDIYCSKNYISLYLKDDESLYEFKYQKGSNYFYTISIKRPIKTNIDDSIVFYDLETAYGYGGYYTNSSNENFLSDALEAYFDKCRTDNIVAEFIRYHPFQEIPSYIEKSLDFFVKDRKTVYIDLNVSKTERWGGYPKKTRNILRRCQENLTFRETNDLHNFKRIYASTMKKNNATNFYFFDDTYFDKLINMPNTKLYEVMLDDIVISAGFFIYGDSIAHYHLSGNDYGYSKYNGNYFLLDSVCDELKKTNSISILHLGGGITGLEDDNLLKFKQKFSSESAIFNIAGKVYNKYVYDKLNQAWQKRNPNRTDKYFLKYRLQD